MNIACPECHTVYRLDPEKLPAGGARTRCRECDTRFLVVDTVDARQPGAVVEAARVIEEKPPAAPAEAPAATEPAGAGDAAAAPVFGPQDPETRARRVARALVSDIKVYHPDKWAESRAAGTLRREFRSEILKSWEEYVEQVGESMAKKTPYFRDALNEILAGGEKLF